MARTLASISRVRSYAEHKPFILNELYVFLLRFGPYALAAVATVALVTSLSRIFLIQAASPISPLFFLVFAVFAVIGGVFCCFVIWVERIEAYTEYVRIGALKPAPDRSLTRWIAFHPHFRNFPYPEIAQFGGLLFFALLLYASGAPFFLAVELFWPLAVLLLALVSYNRSTEYTLLLVGIAGILIIAVGSVFSQSEPTLNLHINGIPPILQQILLLLPNVIWLVAFWISLHYIFRRERWATERNRAVGQIAEKIKKHPAKIRQLFTPELKSPDQFWAAIARYASQKLALGVFTILAHDESNGQLLIRGSYLIDRGYWEGKSWSTQEGITGWVVRNKTSLSCPNVKWAPHLFKPIPGYETKSEIAVPIIVRNRVRGVLDIQSPHTFRFDDNTLAALEFIAEAIAATISQAERIEREVERQFDFIQALGEDLKQCATIEDMLQVIATKTCENYGASSVTVYRLSPGLEYPLVPPKWYGSLRFPEKIECPILWESVLHNLISDWEFVFGTDSPLNRTRQHYFGELGRNPSFVEREGIVSSAFIPLGTRDRKIAVMFVNYCRPYYFSRQVQIALAVLANSVSLVLELREEFESSLRSRQAKKSILHGGVWKSIALVRSSIRADRELEQRDTRKSQLHSNNENEDLVLGNLQDLERAIRNIWTNLDTSTRMEEGLEYLLTIALRPFRPDEDIKKWLDISVDRAVDLSPDEVKIELFSLAYEAVVNALRHSNAKHIRVRLEFWTRELRLVVCDDGCSFSSQSKGVHPDFDETIEISETGIESRLRHTKKRFGGVAKLRGYPNLGTIVKVTMPVRAMEG